MLKGYLISGIIEFSLFAIVLIIRKLISDEGLESFLIYFHKKDLLLFCKGAFYGIIFFLIYPITIIAFGLGQLGLSLDKIYITLEVIFMDIFNCFMIALFEESLFRGYILQKLLKRFPMWISVGISSIIFGALHYNSYSGASNVMIGLINASLIGIILSIAVINTNSLMLALRYIM